MAIDTNRILIVILLLGFLFMYYKYQQHINKGDEAKQKKKKRSRSTKISEKELVSNINKETSSKEDHVKKSKKTDLISLEDEDEDEDVDLGSLADVNTDMSIPTPQISKAYKLDSAVDDLSIFGDIGESRDNESNSTDGSEDFFFQQEFT